ncbi:MAG: hypothetical protein AABW83_03970 [Nanoarchaeota archaeon]
MKREYVLSFLSGILSISLVSAQNTFLDRGIESLSQALGSIFAPIFGTGFGEFLFAKIMLFFLLFAIIFVSLRQIDIFAENRAVHVVLTSVTSVLAIRYLEPGEFINAILLPYTALGAALSTFLPLLIFFYFAHKSGLHGFGRRAAWFIYLIFFIMLWGTREYDTLGDANWIYLIALGFMLINLFLDKSIHAYFGLIDESAYAERLNDARIARLEVEKSDIMTVTSQSPAMRRRLIAIDRELRRTR